MLLRRPSRLRFTPCFLQSVLNASVMRKCNFDHITATLYWLPIRQRTVYKVCTIVYKCIHGIAPSYLAEICTPVAASTGRRNLRSATHGDLLVPDENNNIDHAVLQSLDPVSGMVCHRPCVHHPARSDSFNVQSTLKTMPFCSAYGT